MRLATPWSPLWPRDAGWEDVLAALRARLGHDVVTGGAEVESRYLGDWILIAPAGCTPAALINPRTVLEVSTALAICHAHQVAVVAQGGRTGLTGGATPADGSVILSLERLRGIERPEPASGTVIVEAGATLQAVQEVADQAGLFFPLDIGSRGSCTIGGNIATNAGGNRVLRYGMMRDLVLGLEVVLADGTVLGSLNTMLKNNTGYDLKQLFVGSEGTLGVVTRAALRLFPKPLTVQTALCAVTGYDQVLALLARARGGLGGSLSAFEVMWPDFYRLGTEACRRRAPVPEGHGAYVLVEAMGVDPERDAVTFARVLEQALEDEVVADAVIAGSMKETAELWAVRDSSGEFQKTFWPYVGFDVSLPVRRIGEFVEVCSERLQARWRGIGLVFFGHVADSNIHIGVKPEVDPLPEAEIDEVVYNCVRDFGGSISAEHGIGLLKKAYLGYSRGAAEIELMRGLKRLLDPNGILNPGKIF